MLNINQIKENDSLTLITHKNCSDGYGCVVAATQFCDDNNIELNVIYCQHGQEFILENETYNDMITDKNVIMGDFSYGVSELEAINKIAKGFIVLDHHKTSEEALSGLSYCLFDMKKSGATMVWDYLYPNSGTPMIIKFIEDRDIWRFTYNDTNAVAASIRQMGTDAPELLMEYLDDNKVEELVNDGNVIINYMGSRTVSIANKEHPIVNIGGLHMPCFNNSENISEVGNAVASSTTTSACAQYFITEDTIVFSLRSVNGVDIGSICKKYGGGGHSAAGGFSFPLDTFKFDFLQTNVLTIPEV